MPETGKWDKIYEGTQVGSPTRWGGETTYSMGYEWLKDCALIEDWGCGAGGFKLFCPPEKYRGVDGSRTVHAYQVADLEDYTSKVEGIFMRHVLEHNLGWRNILINALYSFQKRMFIAIFTPFSERTEDHADEQGPHWRDFHYLWFNEFDIRRVLDKFPGIKYTIVHDIPSATQYRKEQVIYLEKTHE